MAPLTLKGDTLGEKHKQFNALVNEAVKTETPFKDASIETDSVDVDNLYKIEVASRYRNVEYIIEVLKSEDMLYVSRAIKKSTWLITDNQYAHIINPQYLYSELFPWMYSKAIRKLLLNIRLHLKDERRVEEFYNYYEERNIETALKWLPNCSLRVIERSVEKNANKIQIGLFKRLCEKSFTILEIFNKNSYCSKDLFYEVVNRFLYTYTDMYLNTIERLSIYEWPSFGKKHTAVIMKKCPDRVLNKFEMYVYKIDIETFGRYLGRVNVKDFILKQAENRDTDDWYFFKPLLKVLPKVESFEFIKSVFFSRETSKGVKIANHYPYDVLNESHNLYEWYQYVRFETTFPTLKKFVKSEFNPVHRQGMFKIMLLSAEKNLDHIQSLLRYYHDEHINEQYKNKIEFINDVIIHTDTHTYDKNTWNLLNDLFHSVGAYNESDNDLHLCIEAIIAYKVLHQELIPEIIERKFNFATMKKLKTALNIQEKEHIFKYLYAFMETKIKEGQLINIASAVHKILELLSDWDKELVDFPIIVNKIKELCALKKEKQWTFNLGDIYRKNKLWRKYLFEQSLLLSCTEESCINALKHNPTLINRHSLEIEMMFCDDTKLTQRFASKLRIFWPQTLGKYWKMACRKKIEETERGRHALTRGLCALSTQKELLELIENFAPKEKKINWGEENDNLLYLRKCLAKCMHIARPQPLPLCILRYAQGDYLQYALPSLYAIFNNLPAQKSYEHLLCLIKSNVSSQKHGIRVAFKKLTVEELTEIFSGIWITSTNVTTRVIIFKECFHMVCVQEYSTDIMKTWQLLKYFIQNLSKREHNAIYRLMQKVEKVPKMIQAEFCQTSKEVLESLSAKSDCDNMLLNVAERTVNLMDTMDPIAIEEQILSFIDEWFVKEKILSKGLFGYAGEMMNVMVSYLLCVTDEDVQKCRYDKIFKELLNHSLAKWDKTRGEHKVVAQYYEDFIITLVTKLKNNFVKDKYIVPLKMFLAIKTDLESDLPVEKGYHTILISKLVSSYVKCYDRVKDDVNIHEVAKDIDDDYDALHERRKVLWSYICPLFAEECIKLLKEEINLYYPSVQIMFSNALRHFQWLGGSCYKEDYDFPKILLESALSSNEPDMPLFLTSLAVMPKNADTLETKNKVEEIHAIICGHPSREVKMHYFRTNIHD